MNKEYLNDLFSRIADVTVCVVGDVCLDIYWHADMKKSVLSRETPHFPLPVTEERYSLGGGGNVMANVSALGVKAVLPVSVLGADWRGYLARECFKNISANAAGLITDETRVTPCYAKPLRQGISDVAYEDPRLDFENRSPLTERTENEILAALDKAAARADAIAVSDQLEYGVVTPRIREMLCELGKTMPVIVDSRDRIALYDNVIIKPNEFEAAGALGSGFSDPADAAKALSAKTGAPVIVTLGDKGAVWCEGKNAVFVRSTPAEPPVDPVGAGDTFLAAFAAAYAAGAAGPEAVEFANLAAGITVKKIGTTGTATESEILQLTIKN